jgi:signal transduction histidine kinase
VADVSLEPDYLRWPATSRTQSELTLPLKAKSGVIGILNVESNQRSAFDESDRLALQALANQVAIAVENAYLYEQSRQTAVAEERNRLARELHDAVTQTLFSASLIAEALPAVWESNPREGRDLLSELRHLSRGALAEMRTLLMELRPSVLAESNLEDLLRQLTDAVIGREGIKVNLVIEGNANLPGDVRITLYRIGQEALNNVSKHARASQVSMVLRYLGSCGNHGSGRCGAMLTVQDNGRGFDPERVAPNHLGLKIMSERAQAIGATLAVESQIGQGTQVTVLWEEVEEEK